MTNEQTPADAKPIDGWLIHKSRRGWYRPNAKGYTTHPAEAGRYSLAEAMTYAYPNGLCGPRDGLTIKHESEFPPAPADDKDATIARLTAENAMLTTAGICEVAVRNPRVMEYMKHWETRAEQAEDKLSEVTAERERLQAAIKRQAGAAKTLREATLAEVQHLRDKDRSEYIDYKTLDSEREANAKLTEEVERLQAAGTFAQGVEAAKKAVGKVDVYEPCVAYAIYDVLHSIRALSPTPQADPVREPTDAMLIAARDWSDRKYGKPIGNDAAIECWQVMYDALAQKEPGHD